MTASADRRPVDPPPVVQLTIWEEHGAERIDITSTYPASFFLFTTLENARNINHGRVAIQNNNFPALTGMPCAGMAYLERPSPGGYFIFPDLSVRHEGKYLLSFNLYEETKNSLDEDLEGSATSVTAPSPSSAGGSAVHSQKNVRFRLEIRSMPFQVYSAKKFPGLAESTPLSRVVAEQGCRVRIRRDVRMRRRDTKDPYDFEEEHQHIRPDTQYPTYGPDRPRSVSNSSVHTAITAGAAGYPQGRRPSQDHGYQEHSGYHTSQPTVPSAPTTAHYADHLVFGGSQYGPSSFQPPPAPMGRNLDQYQAPSNAQYPSASHPRHLSSPQDYTYQTSVQQQSPYQPMPRHSADLTPMNNGQVAPQQPMYQIQSQVGSYMNQQYGTMNHDQYAPSYPSAPSHAPTSNGLPPLNTASYTPQSKQEPMSQQMSLSAGTTPQHYDGSSNGFPFPSPSQPNYSTQPIGATQMPSYVPPDVASSAQPRSRKRGLDEVFDTFATQQPMQNGARPNPEQAGQDLAYIEGADGYDTAADYPDLSMLTYKRADGRQQVKKAPSPVAD